VRQPPIFLLEEPHYHRVRPGALTRFRGIALAAEGREIEELTVARRGETILRVSVDRPSPELVPLARLPRSARCRFEFDLVVEGSEPYEIRAELPGQEPVPLFQFDAGFVAREKSRLTHLARDVSALPAPPADLVAATQGGSNVEAYRDSMVSGLLTIEDLLRSAGASPPLRHILDFGCGTGRLLAGWHCDDRSRTLVGVDVNGDLIRWNREKLPGLARWEVAAPRPPLSISDLRFDFVQIVSVFTHLPLESQTAWLGEVRRFLEPGGVVLVTLHGDTYGQLVLDPASRDEFERAGYVESAGGPEGSNTFATFHSPSYARELFRSFDVLAHFPRGNPPGRVPRTFPIASLQDVYVLRG
jgi:ubiquinone/menaquinone biosynthesis C-methylase UbiE